MAPVGAKREEVVLRAGKSARRHTAVCPLCLTRPADSREHVWASWYLQDQDRRGPGLFSWTRNGEPITNRDGDPIGPGDHRMRIMLSTCSTCNGTLAKRFEDPARTSLRRLFATEGHTALTAVEADAAGAWFAKTLLLLGLPQSRYANPRVDRHAVRFADDETPARPFYDWLVTGQPPPSGLSVWLHRADLTSSRRPRYTVPLPYVTADGVTHAFTQSEVGLHGLSVTLVVHPGWPILHPLVAEGAAVQILPTPGRDLDLRTLPILWTKAIRWTRCRVELKSGVFGSPHLPPLKKAPDVVHEVLPFTTSWTG